MFWVAMCIFPFSGRIWLCDDCVDWTYSSKRKPALQDDNFFEACFFAHEGNKMELKQRTETGE